MREILSFSHVGFNVRSLEVSRKFYERLGFRTLLEADLNDPAVAPLFALPQFKSARFARDPDGYLVEFFDQNMIPQYIP